MTTYTQIDQICQVVSISSSDGAELSLSSKSPSLGQSSSTSSANPELFTVMDGVGQCAPRCTLFSVSANQDCCHWCLLNCLGSTPVVTGSSRPVVRIESCSAYQYPRALCHLQCLLGLSISYQGLSDSYTHWQYHHNVFCKYSREHTPMCYVRKRSGSGSFALRKTLSLWPIIFLGSRISCWITSAESSLWIMNYFWSLTSYASFLQFGTFQRLICSPQERIRNSSYFVPVEVSVWPRWLMLFTQAGNWHLFMHFLLSQ